MLSSSRRKKKEKIRKIHERKQINQIKKTFTMVKLKQDNSNEKNTQQRNKRIERVRD